MEEKMKEPIDQDHALVKIITTAIKIPGVKVNRDNFLLSIFEKKSSDEKEKILKLGPVKAGCSQKELLKIAKNLVTKRAMESTGLSFAAGLPGGIAMAATIPADVAQFYGTALKLAQEISYLYGSEDLWNNEELDTEKITNHLILYCGVMFGASGAAEAVKIMSSALAKQALKKLPQMALTKTFYYPVIKSVLKFFGVSLTKSTFAKGVSKAIPIVGGVVSGGITWFSMRPMGMRLVETFDEAHFSYTEDEILADWEIINEGVEDDDMNDSMDSNENTNTPIVEQIKEAKILLDEGVITQEEFEKIKSKLLTI